MLRFNRSDHHPPNYLSQREQLRVLRLVLALGLIVLLINAVGSPRAAQMLGIFFGGPQQADVGARGGPNEHPPLSASREAAPTGQERAQPSPAAGVQGLAKVKDHAPFRSQENEPWYRLLGILHDMTPLDLASASLGEITAVQFLEQPAAYRGQLVDVRGTARQVVRTDPLASRLDSRTVLGMYFEPAAAFPAFALRTTITGWFLADYHRVVIQQPGAAVPIIAFSLSVPDELPRGESLSEPVSVSGGFFFKNWLFAADDGMGVAPVVLARRVEWHPSPPPAAGPEPPETAEIAVAVISALLLAIGVTGWLIKRSRVSEHPAAVATMAVGPSPDFSFGDSECHEPPEATSWPARRAE